MLEKTTTINMLYDFYHPLLTNKQKSYMEMYYREDYSLGEIAELSQVSRQAVYDTIKRTEQLLQSYETHLLLLDKFRQRNRLLQELEELLHKQTAQETAIKLVNKLQKID